MKAVLTKVTPDSTTRYAGADAVQVYNRTCGKMKRLKFRKRAQQNGAWGCTSTWCNADGLVIVLQIHIVQEEHA